MSDSKPVPKIETWEQFEKLRNGDYDFQIATELGVELPTSETKPDEEDEYTCPQCDAVVPVEIEHWTELFLWNGTCQNCGTEVEMENDFDTEGGGTWWLIKSR
jgi:hypothetical protein